MKEVLTVNVILDDVNDVKSENSEACMLCFHGTFETSELSGDILPGGVDTQFQVKGQNRTLSARYILEGKKNGKTYRLFVENNGVIVDDKITTTPKIITDCDELKYLETAELYGEVEGAGEGRVTIHIYEK